MFRAEAATPEAIRELTPAGVARLTERYKRAEMSCMCVAWLAAHGTHRAKGQQEFCGINLAVALGSVAIFDASTVLTLFVKRDTYFVTLSSVVALLRATHQENFELNDLLVPSYYTPSSSSAAIGFLRQQQPTRQSLTLSNILAELCILNVQPVL